MVSTDSIVFIEHPEFKGVLFTQNFIVGCIDENQINCITLLEFTIGLDPVTFWEADLQNVNQLEKVLQEHYLATHNKLDLYEQGDIPYKSLKVPLRQYVGYTDHTGAKYIWVNMFPPHMADLPTPDSNKYDVPRWRREPIMVEGGGPGVFNFRYNVKTKELTEFYYNARR